MIVTTTPQFEGKRIIEYRGIVYGDTIHLYDMFPLISSNLGNIQEAMTHAKRTALDLLIHNALQLGANAIVGITFDLRHSTRSITVLATGTAVVVE